MSHNIEMWSLILDGLKLKTGRASIPIYIKNILQINGFDSMDVLSKLNEDAICEMEIFAKSEMGSLLDENENPKDYYNIFSNCKDKFKFVLGHRLLLTEIGAFAKEFINRKVDVVPGKDSGSKEKQGDGKKVSLPDNNINGLTDNLYLCIKRQLSKLKDDEAVKIKEVTNTSGENSSNPLTNGYQNVSIF